MDGIDDASIEHKADPASGDEQDVDIVDGAVVEIDEGDDDLDPGNEQDGDIDLKDDKKNDAGVDDMKDRIPDGMSRALFEYIIMNMTWIDKTSDVSQNAASKFWPLNRDFMLHCSLFNGPGDRKHIENICGPSRVDKLDDIMKLKPVETVQYLICQKCKGPNDYTTERFKELRKPLNEDDHAGATCEFMGKDINGSSTGEICDGRLFKNKYVVTLRVKEWRREPISSTPMTSLLVKLACMVARKDWLIDCNEWRCRIRGTVSDAAHAAAGVDDVHPRRDDGDIKRFRARDDERDGPVAPDQPRAVEVDKSMQAGAIKYHERTDDYISSDHFDGDHWRRLATHPESSYCTYSKRQEPFLQNIANLGLILNVDGFQVFGRKTCLTAIYISIPNLPIYLRDRQENVILLGKRNHHNRESLFILSV